MKKMIPIQYLALFAFISVSWVQKAHSAPPQKGQSATINLTCSGAITDWTIPVTDSPVSGVYVEIRGETVSLFNLPTFPDYQKGMKLDIYNKNPSKIWARNPNQLDIVSTINRLSGEIYVEEVAPSGTKLLRQFKGKCTNQKPVF
jgi:hypothetical protein